MGFGSFRPSYEEISRYAIDVLGHSMRPVEIRAIRRLADVYIEIEHTKRKQQQSVSQTGKGKSSPVIKKVVAMDDSDGLKALFARAGRRPPKMDSSSKPSKPSA